MSFLSCIEEHKMQPLNKSFRSSTISKSSLTLTSTNGSSNDIQASKRSQETLSSKPYSYLHYIDKVFGKFDSNVIDYKAFPAEFLSSKTEKCSSRSYMNEKSQLSNNKHLTEFHSLTSQTSKALAQFNRDDAYFMSFLPCENSGTNSSANNIISEKSHPLETDISKLIIKSGFNKAASLKNTENEKDLRNDNSHRNDCECEICYPNQFASSKKKSQVAKSISPRDELILSGKTLRNELKALMKTDEHSDIITRKELAGDIETVLDRPGEGAVDLAEKREILLKWRCEDQEWKKNQKSKRFGSRKKMKETNGNDDLGFQLKEKDDSNIAESELSEQDSIEEDRVHRKIIKRQMKEAKRFYKEFGYVIQKYWEIDEKEKKMWEEFEEKMHEDEAKKMEIDFDSGKMTIEELKRKLFDEGSEQALSEDERSSLLKQLRKAEAKERKKAEAEKSSKLDRHFRFMVECALRQGNLNPVLELSLTNPEIVANEKLIADYTLGKESNSSEIYHSSDDMPQLQETDDLSFLQPNCEMTRTPLDSSHFFTSMVMPNKDDNYQFTQRTLFDERPFIHSPSIVQSDLTLEREHNQSKLNDESDLGKEEEEEDDDDESEEGFVFYFDSSTPSQLQLPDVIPSPPHTPPPSPPSSPDLYSVIVKSQQDLFSMLQDERENDKKNEGAFCEGDDDSISEGFYFDFSAEID
ncbi:uncharacterized protein MONOS_7868 [Monocercomonoides exilis]|uniref:uncharacterized protein n=1 Tax=Monocercomonoides exilis TaxID=2049356 RepID=UPI003559FB4F|nr:hypothetical protein MONOS_7868 [Monocercomonoides exilis]|eukprot:MONOS_7868.1-p1 / transcript=MONOS_7868.1 / gene=MONOS_7868 / organism=Monocercomonoides_exilis_PA203 / gene_product=unspecified product / transcript_product=unspecified product / location=Mono_scaffold00281:2171-4309(+) / protein_length=695 / sequence_SO=supercontig / SO=protein_coding / is_pseudo=false